MNEYNAIRIDPVARGGTAPHWLKERALGVAERLEMQS
jgi:hypothetical protein